MSITQENTIENGFIDKLKELKYIYRPDIRDKETLEQNFREKFQKLNKVNLTDNEFSRLKEQIIHPDVFKTSTLLRGINSFEREDGTPLHYTLVNIKNWCKNSFEVVNQLRINTKKSFHRYDVILLLNGLPLVQIELKTLQISPRRAMQQILDYKKDAGNGYANTLLAFMQLFIVSNHSNTWYFANNNNKHFSFDADEKFLPIYQYADKDNNKIINLDSFSDAFLSKCTLGEMISRYMVLIQNEQKLMMMRPYQIYAVEAIVECVDDNRGNGYIWHTTGSGKTLTSFKASTLLKYNEHIKKVLFVVDRKDLDRQTREEFNKFQENCVEENTNTHTLVERLLSTDYANKVIVTTIQKLGLALDEENKNNYKKQLSPLAKERIVFIFDECHRSQFGNNHKAIKEFFPNSQLFGFTGTPIFEKNATSVRIEGDEASKKTTKDIFQKELHNYTITNAIDDKNVLRFNIEYFKPDDIESKEQGNIVTKKAITQKIIQKHDKASADKKFNALLATNSINNAIEYFECFQKIDHTLNVACVFSPPAEGNKDVAQLQEDLPNEREDNKQNPEEKKRALKKIIDDYNTLFSTNHDINQFDNYYQDVQDRIKNQKYPNADLPHKEKIDIVIVVDMLLTGFDSKFLNTLYVDKNLKYHSLIQAFSRTNRVLNDTKPYGNIITFNSQQDAVNDAVVLFSGKNIDNPKEIWLVESTPKTIKKFQEATQKLDDFMHAQGLENNPSEIANLQGDIARAEFVNTFKEIQRLKTQLDQHTDLTPKQIETIETTMPQDTLRAFRGVYIDVAKNLKDKVFQNEDVPNEMQELDCEFVLFASALIDFDYIMTLVFRYSQDPIKSKISKEQLISILRSDSKFLDEREMIIAFVDTIERGKYINVDDIKKRYENFKNNAHITQLQHIAKKHNLAFDSLQEFVDLIIERDIFDGELLTDLFIPLGLGWKERDAQEHIFMTEIRPLLNAMAKGNDIAGLEVYDE